MNPCQPGEQGKVYLTTMNNFSMPLIRYDIGDTAIVAENSQCSCGRGWPLIRTVTGRTSDHFKTRDGKIIHGEYFTHLLYHRENVKKFRFIQHDYDDVELLMEVDDNVDPDIIRDIESKVKFVLGEKCSVKFKQVNHIPPSKSGKYRYTISEIPNEL
jgi:phenylacetate-CoA ligase